MDLAASRLQTARKNSLRSTTGLQATIGRTAGGEVTSIQEKEKERRRVTFPKTAVNAGTSAQEEDVVRKSEAAAGADAESKKVRNN